MTELQPQPNKSDLPVRFASAVVMVAVAGTALWLGGWVWTAFVAAVALGVLWEWRGLVDKFASSLPSRVAWYSFGILYIGVGSTFLSFVRSLASIGLGVVATVLGMVIATDIGAYFLGRTLGGPKIAPRISPSKTWAGLTGGILAASAVAFVIIYDGYRQSVEAFAIEPMLPEPSLNWSLALLSGIMVATAAQAGDFFESWMKRRAGVKDSAQLIPGHGGLFDRVDGLLAVCFVLGLVTVVDIAWENSSPPAAKVENLLLTEQAE